MIPAFDAKKPGHLLCLCLLAGTISGFSSRATAQETPSAMLRSERQILQLMNEIKDLKDDSLAIRKHIEVEQLLAKILILPEAYLYPFDSLTMTGRLYAPDRTFRLINWNHAFQDGTQRHFGLIAVPTGGELNTVIWLTDRSDSIQQPEQQILSADDWYGALYYRIIGARTADDGKLYYTLLGVDMNRWETKKKIIEVLSFGKNGTTVQFGAPLIEFNGWTKKRLVFEFSSQQTMYLEYNKRKKRIEMDHLAPPMPYMLGQYEYYGPDGRTDGLKFVRRHWKHRKNISIRKIRKKPVPPEFQLGKPMTRSGEEE
ncbi:MAG: hypothetical protein LBS03_00310 [Bacteroidales bacterium]|jgi:hypothetical protein|nr:hypothetical protein [Bacteroidales bacterium]